MALNAAQFEQLVQQLMSPDNNQRTQAEHMFNEVKKNADFAMMSLLQMIRTSQLESVRSLSTILLRRAIGRGEDSLWPKLTPQAQQTLKQQLLEALDVESVTQIRSKLADTIAELGVTVLPTGQWNELLPFMFKCTKSENEFHRESALSIFSQLSQYIGEKLRDYMTVLKDIFVAGLQDPKSIRVRIAALKATTNFLRVVNQPHERTQFQQLLPLMLGVISSSLNEKLEEDARFGLELFLDIAEFDPTFLRPSLEMVAQAMLTIATATSLEDSTRQLGVEFLVTLAENKPGMLRKLPKFIETLLPVVLSFMLDLSENSNWDSGAEEDDVEITNSDVGEEALDRLALALGGKTLVPILFSMLPSMMSNHDWKHRHTALMSISVVGEGCIKNILPILPDVVKNVLPFLQDPHPRVRWAACNTLGQMSTDFGPEFQTMFHNSVLPGLIHVMDDKANPRVQSHAAAAVINFCEHSTADLLSPYLDALLSKLFALLQTGKVIVQEQAMTAIAAVADAAESHFFKYYDSFMPALKSLLTTLHNKEHRMLRGKTIECISLIGAAVGKEKFAADAKEVMQNMISTQASTLEADDPQINFLLQSWARICRCLGPDFVPYLSYVMPPLLKSAKISPDVTITDADSTENPEGWEFIPVGDKRIGIHTSGLEEKATACNMLYCYASELKEGFFQYVEEVSQILVPLIRFYYHDGVRSAAITTMPHLLTSASTYLQKAGAANGAQVTYVRNLLNYMYPSFMEGLTEEADMELLATMLVTLADCLAVAGPNALNEEQVKKAMGTCQTIIQEVHERRRDRKARQSEEDHDDEEEEKIEDEDLRDDDILSGVAELLGKLVQYHGQIFLSLFPQLSQDILNLLKPWSKPSDRQVALCIFDDIVEHVGKPAFPHLQEYFPLAIEYIGDEDATVRQAAVYGMGVCCQVAGDLIVSGVPEILKRLVAVIQAPGSREAKYATCTDNAIAAVGKFLQSGYVQEAANLLPLWLSWLPVKDDKIESKLTYGILCNFLESSNSQLLGAQFEFLPKVLLVFAEILGTDLIDGVLTTRIVNILKQMQTKLPPNVLQKTWTSLPVEAQQKLQLASK